MTERYFLLKQPIGCVFRLLPPQQRQAGAVPVLSLVYPAGEEARIVEWLKSELARAEKLAVPILQTNRPIENVEYTNLKRRRVGRVYRENVNETDRPFTPFAKVAPQQGATKHVYKAKVSTPGGLEDEDDEEPEDTAPKESEAQLVEAAQHDWGGEYKLGKVCKLCGTVATGRNKVECVPVKS